MSEEIGKEIGEEIGEEAGKEIGEEIGKEIGEESGKQSLMSPTPATALIVNGKRLDGRGPEELRPIRIRVGFLKKANGSCYLEWGMNKVVAGVYGPREVFPRHLANPYKAIVQARYIMTPFSSLEERSKPGPNRRSIEISKVIRHALENIILVEEFPNTQINVDIEVLQSDGGTRIAAITAASLALVDAGIPVKDIICGVSVGKADGQIIVDLNKYEDNLGEVDMPTVISLRTGEILLLQMDGMLKKHELEHCLNLAFKACEKINALQLAALQERYAAPPMTVGLEEAAAEAAPETVKGAAGSAAESAETKSESEGAKGIESLGEASKSW